MGNPKKIFIGIDAGDRPGYKLKTKNATRNWFTIVGAVTSNFEAAKQANNEITKKWGNKKGKQLHQYSTQLANLLLTYPITYYLFAFNKQNVSSFFANHYKDRTFRTLDSPPDFNYSAITKKYTLHSWLTLRTLTQHQYKGNIEIRIDNELHGKAWKQYKQEIEKYCQDWFNHYDIKKAGMEYPLIRIADIIANHAYYHLKKQIWGPKKQFPQIIEQLQEKTILMTLNIREDTKSTQTHKIFQMQMQTSKPVNKNFCVWG